MSESSDFDSALGALELLRRAEPLKAMRRWEEALALCRRAVAMAPDESLAHAYCAECLYFLNRLDEAAETAGRVIALAPDDDVGYRLRALALLPDRKIYLGEGRAVGQKVRAKVARLNRRLTESLELARRAVALAPDEPYNLQALALSAAQNGQMKEARDAASKATTLDPSPHAHSVAGLVEVWDGKYQDAARIFRAGLAIDPEDPELMNNLGLATRALETGQPEKAAAYYAQAARLHPGHQTVRDNIIDTVPTMAGGTMLLPALPMAVHPIAGVAALVVVWLYIHAKRREWLHKLDPMAAEYVRSHKKRWTLRQWVVSLVFLAAPSLLSYPAAAVFDPHDRLAFRAIWTMYALAALFYVLSFIAWREKRRDFSVKPRPKEWDSSRYR